jgi:hypothetical protein
MAETIEFVLDSLEVELQALNRFKGVGKGGADIVEVGFVLLLGQPAPGRWGWGSLLRLLLGCHDSSFRTAEISI